MFSNLRSRLSLAAAFALTAIALSGCAGADLILEHEEAHTVKFDWHRPGAQDRAPPMELRLAALPAGTIVRAYPAPQLALWCLSDESIACTEHTPDGWVIRMLDVDVDALVASGRLMKARAPNTYVDTKRQIQSPAIHTASVDLPEDTIDAHRSTLR